MSTSESKEWLQAGIAAVKSGDKETARTLLVQVVEADEKNEQGWLWLSTIMEGPEDRRICLENVLAINPDSRIAQDGLRQLENSPGDLSVNPGDLTGADPWSSMENSSLEAGQRISEPEPLTHLSSSVGESGLTSLTFNDIWDTDEEICAYCATRLGESDKKCPSCARSLIKYKYRYPASANLHVFWVFLLTTCLLLLFQAMYKYRVEQNDASAILHISLAVMLFPLVISVYLRMFWAHVLSIVVLIAVVLLSIGNFFNPIDPVALSNGNLDPAVAGFASSFIERLDITLKSIQITIASVTLLYAVLRAGPEFDRIRDRQIAKTEKGLRTATDYHMVARKQMQSGLWASAILQWQKASAIDPHNIVYQRQLARAYIKLGFLDRGLATLRSAHSLPMQASTKTEIEKLMTWVEQKITARPKDAQA